MMFDMDISRRWKLNDRDWLKLRNIQWDYAFLHLKLDKSVKKKHHKYWKKYFLFGESIPDDDNGIPIYFSPLYQLFYTPSESIQETNEIIEAIPPIDLRNVFPLVLGFGNEFVGHEFGIVQDQVKYIARALFPEEYKINRVEFRGVVCDLYLDAKKFAERYELLALQFISNTYFNSCTPVQYIIEHWLSCLRYLESINELPDDKNRSLLIESVFYYSEARE